MLRSCSAALQDRRRLQRNVDTFLLKTLQSVSASERLDLSQTDLNGLVASANGDLRHALHSMQFLSAGMARRAAGAAAPRGGGGSATRHVRFARDLSGGGGGHVVGCGGGGTEAQSQPLDDSSGS